jgi:hypothetical protein
MAGCCVPRARSLTQDGPRDANLGVELELNQGALGTRRERVAGAARLADALREVLEAEA